MTREQLIASLALADGDINGYYLTGGWYFDWSTTHSDDDGITMEVGDHRGDAVAIEMTRAEVAALQRRLTAWLLTNS